MRRRGWRGILYTLSIWLGYGGILLFLSILTNLWPRPDLVMFLSLGMEFLALVLDKAGFRCPYCGKWVPAKERPNHEKEHQMDAARQRMYKEYYWMLDHDWGLIDGEPPECRYEPELKRFVWNGISVEALDAAMLADPGLVEEYGNPEEDMDIQRNRGDT